MSFCLRSLGISENEDSQRTLRNSASSTLDGYVEASGRLTPSRPTSSLTVREKHTSNKTVTGEIVVCIQLLTTSPNAPVQANAERILHALGEFVKSSPVAGSGHQNAFNGINTVIMKVLFDQSDLAREFLLDIIPVIRRLWNTKLTGLKDELLGTIMFCTVILTDTARRGSSESLFHLIESLVDMLYSEYTKRPEKDILQIDELFLYQTKPVHSGRLITGPRLGNLKSEHNWSLVWAISLLLELLEAISLRQATSQTLRETSPKKQRVNSAKEDILRDSFSSSGSKKICALQLIPFLLKTQSDVDLKSLLQRLIPNILDDNGTVSSWTMVAVSRFVRFL